MTTDDINSVKFVQRCEMSLTVAKKPREVTQFGQFTQFTPCARAECRAKTDHECTLQSSMHFNASIFAINVRNNGPPEPFLSEDALVMFSEDGYP